MVATIPVRSINAGSKRTVARSVARLTFASATPSARFRKRSMRFTQLAQVMPTTGRVSSAEGSAVVFVTCFRILQGSIRRGAEHGDCGSRANADRRTRDSDHHRVEVTDSALARRSGHGPCTQIEIGHAHADPNLAPS